MATIETKRNLGDWVYFQYQYWLVKAPILKIWYSEYFYDGNCDSKQSELDYFFKINIRDGSGLQKEIRMGANKCYSTIEELCASLEIVEEN